MLRKYSKNTNTGTGGSLSVDLKKNLVIEMGDGRSRHVVINHKQDHKKSPYRHDLSELATSI